MNDMGAHIEDLKFDSIFSHNLKFTEYGDGRERFALCKSLGKLKQCIWLTLPPVIDYGNTLYNPKCMFLIILN